MPKKIKKPDQYANCDWCNQPIQFGDSAVCIEWHIEDANWDDKLHGIDIDVIDAETLLTLCYKCGFHLKKDVLLDELYGDKFRGRRGDQNRAAR